MRLFFYNTTRFLLFTLFIYAINYLIRFSIGLEKSLLTYPIIGREFNLERTFYRQRPACPEFPDTSELLKLKTDRFGLYNNFNIYQPDIVIIGDSYTHGGYLGTENTLSSKLDYKLKDRIVMNLGITGYSDLRFYNFLVSKNYIEEPKVIILEIIERNLLHWMEINSSLTYSPIYDKISRLIDFNYSALLYSDKKSCDLSNRYFYTKKLSEMEDEELFLISKNLLNIQKELAMKNVKIYFMVIPDPENAFREELQLNGRSVVDDFNFFALKAGLNIIDIVSLMRNNREAYYFHDDSHWNSVGVEAVADYVAYKLR